MMKRGGGKRKGSAFELHVCKQLSLWLSRGARADMFARNVLSGGKFTVARSKNRETSIPGDLMANHPAAFDFLKLVMVECKHWQDVSLESFIFDFKAASPLSKVLAKATSESVHAGVTYMLVARQNRRPTFVIMPIAVHDILLASQYRRYHAHIHVLHGFFVMLPFSDLTSCINSASFLKGLSEEKVTILP